MLNLLFQFAIQLICIYVTFQLAIRLVDWGRFLKVTAENERAIRFFIILLSIAVGYIVASFFNGLFEMTNQLLRGHF